MVSMLDVNNVCVLAFHTICTYFVCVMCTQNSLPFSFLSSVTCIRFDTWSAIFHFLYFN